MRSEGWNFTCASNTYSPHHPSHTNTWYSTVQFWGMSGAYGFSRSNICNIPTHANTFRFLGIMKSETRQAGEGKVPKRKFPADWNLFQRLNDCRISDEEPGWNLYIWLQRRRRGREELIERSHLDCRRWLHWGVLSDFMMQCHTLDQSISKYTFVFCFACICICLYLFAFVFVCMRDDFTGESCDISWCNVTLLTSQSAWISANISIRCVCVFFNVK